MTINDSFLVDGKGTGRFPRSGPWLESVHRASKYKRIQTLSYEIIFNVHTVQFARTHVRELLNDVVESGWRLHVDLKRLKHRETYSREYFLTIFGQPTHSLTRVPKLTQTGLLTMILQCLTCQANRLTWTT